MPLKPDLKKQLTLWEWFLIIGSTPIFFLIRIIKWFKRPLMFFTVWLILFMMLFGGTGYFVYFQDSLPDISILKTYRPNSTTTVLDRNAKPIAEFFIERRLLLSQSEIPDIFVQALISAEDKSFFSHHGVDYYGITRAIVKNIGASVSAGEWKNIQGASTLTQQLARQVFLNPREKSIRRKVNEVRLAWKIENAFTKKEILVLYCNQVYFGHGQYGCEAAADYYFGKTLTDLTVEEAAFLAGLLPSPNEYSPLRNPEKAKLRRNEILRRMAQNGYVKENLYETLLQTPIRLSVRREETIAPHALEWIKEILEKDSFTYEDVWKSGLLIRTTLDFKYQKILNTAFEEGLREYESRHELKPYNPLEGAGVLMEIRTGQILAYYGGRDFQKNKFDHARQARRQPGSTFKTFVLAAMFEVPSKKEWSLQSHVRDDEGRCYGSKKNPYCPENFFLEKPRYTGDILVEKAFYQSRNQAFVWLTHKLVELVGVERVFEIMEKFGFQKIEHVLSSALGSSEVTLLEMVRAYGVFPSNGVLVEPHIIQEVATSEGLPRKNYEHEPKRIISEKTSLEMVRALRSVVLRGTGRKAQELPFQVFGKTGTTSRKNLDETQKRDETIDAWFCGFTSEHVLCVWVGYDTPEDLGKNEVGASIALPIFVKAMKEVYKQTPPDDILDEPILPFIKPKEKPIDEPLKEETLDIPMGITDPNEILPKKEE